MASGGTAALTGEVKHASKIPLLAGIALLLLGTTSIPLAFFAEQRWLFLVGYVATPVLVLMAVAWDAMAQRRGSRDPWFSMNKKYSFALRIIATISFIPAGIQIWQISIWIGEMAVQNGWFS